jgi:hypothetical protein
MEMPTKRIRLLVGVCALLAATWSVRAADPVASRRDADLLKQKIALITQHSAAAPSSRRFRTTVTEREVNAYLTYEMQDDLPAGVVNPAVSILGTGRVSGRAVVDLDRVRQERKTTGFFDPLSYLTGRLPVSATGTIKTGAGVARFELESAQVAGIPIPKMLLEQIVSHYSRSPSRPAGFSLDDPVAMPAGIREIQIQRGQAVVIQ